MDIAASEHVPAIEATVRVRVQLRAAYGPATSPPARGPDTEWCAARAVLACEVLDRIGPGQRTLDELQRDVHVPFELELMSLHAVESWRPRDLVAAVLSTLPPRGRQREHQ